MDTIKKELSRVAKELTAGSQKIKQTFSKFGIVRNLNIDVDDSDYGQIEFDFEPNSQLIRDLDKKDLDILISKSKIVGFGDEECSIDIQLISNRKNIGNYDCFVDVKGKIKRSHIKMSKPSGDTQQKVDQKKSHAYWKEFIKAVRDEDEDEALAILSEATESPENNNRGGDPFDIENWVDKYGNNGSDIRRWILGEMDFEEIMESF